MKKIFVSTCILGITTIGFIVLHSYHRVDSFSLIEYSILLFIVLQGLLISYRYWQLFNENQTLISELVSMDDSIDTIVEARTKELLEHNQELTNLQTNRTKMLANIAHDLGPPMVGIQTYLHLMKEGLVQDDDQEVLEQFYEKSEYVKRLIDDLFELSKLESKELSFQMEYVMIKDFIQKVYHKFEVDLRHEKGNFRMGKFETAVEGKEAFIKIDSFRIMQVVQNYIGNAVKFNNSGDDQAITLNCSFIIDESENRVKEVCVEVIDQGIGISLEELPQVFQRFYKKQEGNKKGSGLGLPISKEIIERHGGSVGAESKLGKGSRFYFILPVFLEVELPHADS